MAARRGLRPLSSGRTGPIAELVEQRRVAEAAWRAEGLDPERVPLAMSRFCCITESRDEALRFAENARYQTRLASNLRRREEVMEGTMLADRPFPDEPPLERILENLPIGDAEHVAERLAAEIRAARPSHLCFNFHVGDVPHRTALRSMERFMSEVRPRLERALGPLDQIGPAG
jgi:alkanesulfonate monooxygenase SsuD/methylene tetrahydromethanopterin reductase-like flavin-dependent oxidoreductase (luciferase family)